jgi:hypothetical protein
VKAERLLLVVYLVLLPWMSTTLPLHAQWSDVVFLALTIAFLATGGLRRLQPSPLDRFVLAYVAATALSLVGAESMRTGVAELAKTVAVALVYVVIGTIVQVDDVRERLRRWLAWITVAVAVLGLSAIAGHALFGLPVDRWGRSMEVPYLGHVLRLSVGFVTPELLGEYLTAMLPFVLATGGPLTHAGVVLVALLTFSHAWGGFAAAALVFSWNRWRHRAWTVGRYAAAAAVCGLIVVINLASIVYVHDVRVMRASVPAPADESEDVNATAMWPQVHVAATYNYEYYFVLKQIAWQAFRAHPVTGVGVGQFRDVNERAYRAGVMNEGCRFCMPHSTPFGHLAETGLVGTAALVALWLAAFHRARHRLSPMATAALAGIAVNAINADVMHFRFLWIVLACLR